MIIVYTTNEEATPDVVKAVREKYRPEVVGFRDGSKWDSSCSVVACTKVVMLIENPDIVAAYCAAGIDVETLKPVVEEPPVIFPRKKKAVVDGDNR